MTDFMHKDDDLDAAFVCRPTRVRLLNVSYTVIGDLMTIN